MIDVPPGFVLHNGAIVVTVTWHRPPTASNPVEQGVVLALWPGNHDPYVVWMIERDSIATDIYQGSYFATLGGAWLEYKNRTGRDI